jgi:hypothetical protein
MKGMTMDKRKQIGQAELVAILKKLTVQRALIHIAVDSSLNTLGARNEELFKELSHAEDCLREVDMILGRAIDDERGGTIVLSLANYAKLANHISVIEDCVDMMKACALKDAQNQKTN